MKTNKNDKIIEEFGEDGMNTIIQKLAKKYFMKISNNISIFFHGN